MSAPVEPVGITLMTQPIDLSDLAVSRDVHRYQHKDAASLNDALHDVIAARRRSDPGIVKTNIGDGWHSRTDLADWPSDSIRSLMAFIVESADAAVAAANRGRPGWRRSPWTIQAWANVNPPGGAANAVHDHVAMNWHWSGTYYVRCPSIDADRRSNGPQGRLVFTNRWTGLRLRDRAAAEVGDEYFHAPSEGELVLFPAWQHHRVEPHGAPVDRISIAFNLHAAELERSRYWTHRPSLLARKSPGLYEFVNRLRGTKGHDANGVPPGTKVG